MRAGQYPMEKYAVVEKEIGPESAQHVLRAMREVDDVEKPENDREAEAQHRIEGAVDQPDQELAEKRLRGDAEQFKHVTLISGNQGRWPRPFLGLGRRVPGTARLPLDADKLLL